MILRMYYWWTKINKPQKSVSELIIHAVYVLNTESISKTEKLIKWRKWNLEFVWKKSAALGIKRKAFSLFWQCKMNKILL